MTMAQQDPVQLIDVHARHSDLAALIERLDAYLFRLYPPEEVFLVDLESASDEELAFSRG